MKAFVNNEVKYDENLFLNDVNNYANVQIHNNDDDDDNVNCGFNKTRIDGKEMKIIELIVIPRYIDELVTGSPETSNYNNSKKRKTGGKRKSRKRRSRRTKRKTRK